MTHISQYAINKSKVLFGYVGEHWEQHIVAELDSALNKWVDSVPDHCTFIRIVIRRCSYSGFASRFSVRWDPTREDDDSFNQSASCYALYYHIQILIHRPFIPTPTKPSPLSFPSLAICTNAARSCSHIADIQRRRTRFPPLHTHVSWASIAIQHYNILKIIWIIDGDIYFWYCATSQYLGRKTVWVIDGS